MLHGSQHHAARKTEFHDILKVCVNEIQTYCMLMLIEASLSASDSECKAITKYQMDNA